MVNRRPEGKIASTYITNELADAVNQMPVPTSGLYTSLLGVSYSFVGQILPRGPDMTDPANPTGPKIATPDFKDNRYWVRAIGVGTTTRSDSQVDLMVDNSAVAGWTEDGDLIDNVVEVTNLAEHYPYMQRKKAVKPEDDEEGTLYVGTGTHLIPHGCLVCFGSIRQNGMSDLPDRYVTFTVPRMSCQLKITDPASGGGKYLGYEMRPPTRDLIEEDNVDELDFGAPDVDHSILIFNPDEIGGSGHALMGHQIPRIFTGYFLSSRTDGKRVYALNPGQGGSSGQYQWQSHVMVSNNQAGWDFDRAHPLL